MKRKHDGDGQKFAEMVSLLPHMQFDIFLKINAKYKCEWDNYGDLYGGCVFFIFFNPNSDWA